MSRAQRANAQWPVFCWWHDETRSARAKLDDGVGLLRRCLRPRFAAHPVSQWCQSLAPPLLPVGSPRLPVAVEAAASSSIGTGPTDAFGIETATPQAHLPRVARPADAVLSGRESQQDAMARLRPHMRHDCVFRPPTYHGAWTGADDVPPLGTVSRCRLLVPLREAVARRRWARVGAEFTTEVGGQQAADWH